jgi:hypothetical protein
MVKEETPPPRGPLLEDEAREEQTPRQRPPIPAQLPSDTALRMARASTILNKFATVLGRDAGKLDQLGRSARAALLEGDIADVRRLTSGLLALMNDIEETELTTSSE